MKEKKLAFQPKDLVLSKMTGFPAWPSFVMPQDMIPSAIMKAKKKTTNTCVIFIPDGDFNWMNEKSLEALSQEKLDAKLSKVPKDKLKARPKNKPGRTNNVVEALMAANGLDFDEFMDDLAQQNKTSDNEDDDEEEEDDEQEAQIADDDDDEVPGNDSKETNGAEASDDQIEALDDDSRDTEGQDSERKEAHDDADDDADEDEEDEETGRSGRRKRRAQRTNGAPPAKKSTPSPRNGESKNGKADARKDARSSSPKPMTDHDRQHQLWLCRIKLQRSLIQRNQSVTPKDPKSFPPPTIDELLVARIILHRLADFPVNVELLRQTKIHKVIKCILRDEDLEYPNSFRLHEKCEELLEKWKNMIEGLKVEKQARMESRLSSHAPEDSEISGLDTKRVLEESVG